MTNETKLSNTLQATLRLHLRGCHVIKHHGGMTNSVPDISVSFLGDTFWIEDKLLREGEKLIKVVRTKQLIKAHSLSITTFGKCIYTIFEEQPRQLHIMTPAAVARWAWPKLVFGSMYTTFQTELGQCNLWTALKAHGHLVLPGWPAEAICQFIFDHAKGV